MSGEVDERRFHQVGRTGNKVLVRGCELGEDDTVRLSERGRLGQVVLLGQEVLPAGGEVARQPALELLVLLGVLARVLFEHGVPVRFEPGALVLDIGEELVDLVGDEELLGEVKPERLLDVRDLILTEGGTVGLAGSLEVGREADDGGDDDEYGLAAGVGPSLLERVDDGVNVFTSGLDVDDVPVLSAELADGVLAEAAVDVSARPNRRERVNFRIRVKEEGKRRDLPVDSDGVHVVNKDEVVESQVSSERDGLLSDTLLQASVSGEAEDLGLAGDLEPGSVVLGCDLLASNGESDCVRDALAERTGRDLDSGELDLGVSGSHGQVLHGGWRVVGLELVNRPGGVAGEVEEHVLEETGVAGREDES